MCWEVKKERCQRVCCESLIRMTAEETEVSGWCHAWNVYANAIPINLTRGKQTNKDDCYPNDFTAVWVDQLFSYPALFSFSFSCRYMHTFCQLPHSQYYTRIHTLSTALQSIFLFFGYSFRHKWITKICPAWAFLIRRGGNQFPEGIWAK